MKHILCYGDSNTWGYDPVSGVVSLKTHAGPVYYAARLAPNTRSSKKG